jgi:hypothetical protein
MKLSEQSHSQQYMDGAFCMCKMFSLTWQEQGDRTHE